MDLAALLKKIVLVSRWNLLENQQVNQFPLNRLMLFTFLFYVLKNVNGGKLLVINHRGIYYYGKITSKNFKRYYFEAMN